MKFKALYNFFNASKPDMLDINTRNMEFQARYNRVLEFREQLEKLEGKNMFSILCTCMTILSYSREWKRIAFLSGNIFQNIRQLC